MLTLNHAQMKSGPEISHPKSSPDAYSENQLAKDENEASHMRA